MESGRALSPPVKQPAGCLAHPRCLPTTLDQSIQSFKGFVHPVAGGQDYPDKRIQAGGVGQGQSEGKAVGTGGLNKEPPLPSNILHIEFASFNIPTDGYLNNSSAKG